MLIREIAEVVIGIALVALALRDVFDTVVVPGESAGALRVARRLLFMMLPVWKRLRRGKAGISTSFCAFRADGVLCGLNGYFAVWIRVGRARAWQLVFTA